MISARGTLIESIILLIELRSTVFFLLRQSTRKDGTLRCFKVRSISFFGVILVYVWCLDMMNLYIFFLSLRILRLHYGMCSMKGDVIFMKYADWILKLLLIGIKIRLIKHILLFLLINLDIILLLNQTNLFLKHIHATTKQAKSNIKQSNIK